MDAKFKIIFVVVCAFVFHDCTTTRSTVPRELPHENDTFEDIRKQNKVYVDKSEYIEKLLKSDDRFFIMCRPGRFGKSQFLQMLKSFFEGRKELFEGLDIYNKHDWRTSHPVIYLDFSTLNSSHPLSVLNSLSKVIETISRDTGLDENLHVLPGRGNKSSLFSQTLDHLTEDGKPQIVVLIDEYNWPVYGNSPRNEENFRSYKPATKMLQEEVLIPVLHEFERIKDRIRLLLVTCTVKVNYTTLAECPMLPLKDITFDPQFSGMLGLTEAELEKNFEPHIRAMISGPEETFQTAIEKLKTRYNGYCFARKNKTIDSGSRLYNFHSVMSCLREKNDDYLWHPAANPKYDIIDDYSVSDIEAATDQFEKVFSEDSYNDFRVSRQDLEATAHLTYGHREIPIVVSMVLHGYLTLRDFDWKRDEFVLDFPNEEMRESYRRALLKIIYGRDLPTRQFVELCETLLNSMMEENAASFVDQLNSITFAQREDNKTRSEDWLKRYSTERIDGVFSVCYHSIRHNPPDPYRELYLSYWEKQDGNEKHEYRYLGLQVQLSNERQYWIHFDFNRSAASAMNMLLKKVSSMNSGSSVEQESNNQLIHLMGINFGERGDTIKEWIRITYSHGKCEDLQASHPKFLKMFSYITQVEAYSLLP